MKLNISSDDINLLVYRYLIENGYCHTAFSFNKEASINTNPYYANHADKVPPNALVSFMQKAMIYIYLEYHTDEVTGEQILCDEGFSFFRKHNCFRKLGQAHGLPLSHSTPVARERTDTSDGDKPAQATDSADKGLDFDLTHTGFTPDEVLETNGAMFRLNHPVYVGPPQRRLSDKWQVYGYGKLFEYQTPLVSTVCHFNPCQPGYILKQIENGPASLYRLNEAGKPAICEIVLPLAKLSATETEAGVTTASSWRPDGAVACTGHADASLNLWTLEAQHLFGVKVGMASSPVTALGFSGSKAQWADAPFETYFVAAGCASGEVFLFRVDSQQTVQVHQYQLPGPVTDLEWQDHRVLAALSTGGALTMLDVEANTKLEMTVQSAQSVAFAEWDYNGRYLAVVDDSDSLKFFRSSEEQLQGELMQLKGHTARLVDASWYSGSMEKSSSRICTVAMDKMMIVWDVASETSLMSLALDQMPTTVCVCPNDTLVAIGSYGNSVKMYGLPGLSLVCSFYDQTVPTHLSWSSDRQHLVYNVYKLQRALVLPLSGLASLQSD